jgi:predicted RNA binding protein YcfA (HicA-like mRNA interferase family)
MPLKVRKLKQMLRRAGFNLMPGRGKGSHSMWRHSRYADLIVELSGNDGDDARQYHEADVKRKIEQVKARDEEQP